MAEAILFAPTDNDIVCSKKKKWYSLHPGNIFYNQMLKKFQPTLEEAVHQYPPVAPNYNAMADEILNVLMIERQGRFLKPTDDREALCTVLNREDASYKVQLSLRKHYSDLKFKVGANTRMSLIQNGKHAATPKKQETASDGKENHDGDRPFNNEEKKAIFPKKVRVKLSKYKDYSSSEDEDKDDDDIKWIPFHPKPNDVVCGNASKSYRKHPGNEYYRSLLDDCAPQVQLATPPTKEEYDDMVNRIIDLVEHGRNGRFLRPSDTNHKICFVLSRKDAMEKVVNGLHKKRSDFVVGARNTKSAIPAAPAPASHSHSTRMISPKRALNESHGAQNMGPIKTKKARAKDDGSPLYNAKGWYGDGNDGDMSITSTPPQQASKRPYENLYRNDHRHHHQAITAKRNSHKVHTSHDSKILYGSFQSQVEMRRWLNDRNLPQSVGDVLVNLGARNIDDVYLLMECESKELKGLPTLDYVKLERAVQA